MREVAISSREVAEVLLWEVRIKLCSEVRLQIESKVLAVFNGSYVEVVLG